MIIPGEKGIGKAEPMKSILNKLKEYEKLEGILLKIYFNGYARTDTPHTSASVIVIPESEKHQDLVLKIAKELANYIFDLRHDFQFPMLAFLH